MRQASLCRLLEDLSFVAEAQRAIYLTSKLHYWNTTLSADSASLDLTHHGCWATCSPPRHDQNLVQVASWRFSETRRACASPERCVFFFHWKLEVIKILLWVAFWVSHFFQASNSSRCNHSMVLVPFIGKVTLKNSSFVICAFGYPWRVQKQNFHKRIHLYDLLEDM